MDGRPHVVGLADARDCGQSMGWIRRGMLMVMIMLMIVVVNVFVLFLENFAGQILFAIDVDVNFGGGDPPPAPGNSKRA